MAQERRTSRALLGIAVASLAAGAGGVMWGVQQQHVAHVLADVNDAKRELTPAAPQITPAAVARVASSLKLITVEIDAIVRSDALGESWRGDVEASVDAPVRYYYGTDLTALVELPSLAEPRGVGVRRDPLSGTLIVSLPTPTRVATEVFGERRRTSVEVGWGRTRSRAGEYYLGMAQTLLSQRAREAPLSPGDAREVERLTIEQVERVLRALFGDDAPVRVVLVAPVASTDADLARGDADQTSGGGK
jgi:hypothetical protein